MKFYISLFITTLVICTPLYAQISLDGTLGPSIALEGPDYQIGAELGQQHGSNLFHSFGEFNININESATFSGHENINNVINRVTGGNISSIDGALRSTIPNADVYLINPAGLIFGKNASLDIPGSFHASTADTLRLQDGGEFNARNPQESLLSVAPVSAFGFLTDSPQPLSLESSRLDGSVGKTLSFIGGDIKINNSLLRTYSGRVNIAGIASQGDVIPLPEDLTLSAQPGDVNLRNSFVTASSVTGGEEGGIYIRAGQLFLENTSVQANTRGSANAGKINVQANNLTATGGSKFISNTLGSGQGGEIKISVAGLTEFSGETRKRKVSAISATSRESGDGGNIKLETGSLNLKEGTAISVTTFAQGQGGNINIHATDTITLSGLSSREQGSYIAANSRGDMENAGRGGTITLEAKQLHLADGAQIRTTSLGTGEGGITNIKADSITLSGEDPKGSTSRISTVTSGSADGGSITLETNQLTLKEGTFILADSRGTGQGGNIKIQVNDLVKLEGVDNLGYGNLIAANANGEMEDAGDAGTIELKAGRLQISDGAQIGSSTFGPGKSGTIDIEVAKKAIFSGKDQSGEDYFSGVFTSSESEADNAGDAGSITMKVGELHLNESANINAKTEGSGQGGNINIHSLNDIILSKGGFITAYSQALGNAGQIELNLGGKLQIRDSRIETAANNADGGNLIINTPSYIYLINSRVTTSVSEEFGGGGNVTANPEFVVLDNSQVFAKAKRGKGGNINVTTTSIYNFTGEPVGQIINASSEFGVDGVVVIDTPDNSAEEGLFALPTTLFDASAWMDTPCNQRIAENVSRFIVTEREGAPSSYTDFLPSTPSLSHFSETKLSLNQPYRSETTKTISPKLALRTCTK
ncbi:filamentous hemagglutinin N-terminal domain-containing protein [Candidatus Parabeggiatoa sp. HSG14]|uniref:two-partner secretion domain-containing protein n=1 Tax=Candidatus Parabeggiatoa sp. HSG14 TaxID=3055593 RepID=UPI0025A7D3C1|nr:filamentous hemagglutinin N-terminal domain-containing protein [Thiotrichales bacterium HSG14]